MSRMYKAPIVIATATAARDILEIRSSDNKPIKIHEVMLTTSVAASASEEQVALTIKRFTGAFTSGTGGAAVTGVEMDELGTADATTIETGNTTIAVVGSGVIDAMAEIYMNNRAGWHYLPAPEHRPVIINDGTNGSAWILSQAVVTNTLLIKGWVIYEEMA